MDQLIDGWIRVIVIVVIAVVVVIVIVHSLKHPVHGGTHFTDLGTLRVCALRD